MTNIDSLSKEWSLLKERRAKCISKHDQITGHLESEKKKLKEIVEKIREKGYDPATLGKTLETKKEELEKKVSDLKLHIEEVEEKLSKFNNLNMEG